MDARVRAFMARSLAAPASDSDFNALALALFEAQRAANSAYAKLCSLSPAPRDWREIPAAPTVAFKELDLTSLPTEERACVFHSSGTTLQKPSRHFHSTISMALYEESLSGWFERNVAERLAERRLIFLAPRAADAPNSSLVHMFETIAASRDAEFVGDVEPDGSWSVKAFPISNKPVGIFGAAFLFVQLADKVELDLPKDSWIMETGGYKGRTRELSKPEFHALLHSRLGVARENIFGEYGMSELSSQAYDQADGHFQFPPWARSLVVSPETGREVADGEKGLLRIVDLANVYSVAAIQTEDLAIRRGEKFELAGRATAAEARGCSLMAA